MSVSYDPDHPDIPPYDRPGITRPYTHEELLTSALRALDRVEAVLTSLDPDLQHAISTAMNTANLGGDYGSLIDTIQFPAWDIRKHLETQ